METYFKIKIFLDYIIPLSLIALTFTVGFIYCVVTPLITHIITHRKKKKK